MTDVSQIEDPFVRYVFQFQMAEMAIQNALENAKIKIGEEVFDLEGALQHLAKTYGMDTEQARTRTQVVLNTLAMLDHFKKLTFSTPADRNKIIAAAQDKKSAPIKSPEEKAWEEQVLTEARKRRQERANLELPG